MRKRPRKTRTKVPSSKFLDVINSKITIETSKIKRELERKEQ